MSACTGAGAVNWPLTYQDHPVSTFVNDKKPGATSGEGINALGGSWFAVSPAGDKVRLSLAAAGRRRLRQRLLTIPARRAARLEER